MKGKFYILFTALVVLIGLLFMVDLAVGSVSITLTDVFKCLIGGEVDATTKSIVLDIRLLKAIMAFTAGVALSVSGLQMQTLFRNPLAGPYVLGVSAGASFGVALALIGLPILGVSSSLVQSVGITGFAWLGAATMLTLIVALSRKINDITVILIIGMMLGSALGAVVEIMQYLGSEVAVKSFVVWTMGSLGSVTTTQIAIILPIVVCGIIFAVISIKAMNLLLLGQEYAKTMGVNIGSTRFIILLSTTLLAGTITAYCGPIGFVGLAVPHLARMVTSSADHKILLPSTLCIGAIMMLLCDVISKLVTLPINAITAIMGVPIVIYIVFKLNYKQ